MIQGELQTGAQRADCLLQCTLAQTVRIRQRPHSWQSTVYFVFLSRHFVGAHLAAGLLLLASWQTQAAEAVIGMILKVDGNPRVTNRFGVKRPAVMLDYLKQDDVLLLGPGTVLSFTSYADQQIHQATGPCELKLSAGMIQVVNGAPPSHRPVPAVLQPVQPNPEQVGGAIRLRGGGGWITVLTPGSGSQLSQGRPLLQWELAEAVSLEVELSSESALVIPRQAMAASSHVLAVEQDLPPGRYRFKLYLQRDKEVAEQEWPFTVLSPEALQSIRALQPAPQASEDDQLLYLDYLIRIKADDERSALMQSWSSNRPTLLHAAQSIRRE